MVAQPQRRVPSVRELLGVRERAVVQPTMGEMIDVLRHADPVWWIEDNYYVPEGGRMVVAPHQKVVLRVLLQKDAAGRFFYSTAIYSCPKKGGKTSISGAVARYTAETQGVMQEIYAVGNDLKQATERAYQSVRQSIELTPGYDRGRKVLPGRWRVLEKTLTCMTTMSKIHALAVDAAGEAGGKPSLSIWTELWGAEYPAAIRFWHELTTVPTLLNSVRWVETYAGHHGESKLLRGLYDRGMGARQLTNGEVARIAARDKDGERYEDLLRAWENETWGDTVVGGDPDALVPIWVDEHGFAMYWDSGQEARRMPWQRGDAGRRYYVEQERSELPEFFEQHHNNSWTDAQSALVPIALWDALSEDLPPFLPGDRTPCVIGVDAASTYDSFGVLVVTRHPERSQTDVAVRACRKWDPPKGGMIDYSEPEGFIRFLVQGGCAAGHPQYPPFRRTSDDVTEGAAAQGKEPCAACDAIAGGDGSLIVPGYNVVEIAYDAFQLRDMMQRFGRESMMSDRENPHHITVCTREFPQKAPRARADKRLYDLIVNRQLAHLPLYPQGDPRDMGQRALREHVQNAARKTQKDEDSWVRIVKKSDGGGKIDLAVCCSMACDRILEVIL